MAARLINHGCNRLRPGADFTQGRRFRNVARPVSRRRARLTATICYSATTCRDADKKPPLSSITTRSSYIYNTLIKNVIGPFILNTTIPPSGQLQEWGGGQDSTPYRQHAVLHQNNHFNKLFWFVQMCHVIHVRKLPCSPSLGA